MLLLANVLLVMVIVNASDAFDAMDRVGEAAESLETAADTIDVLAAELGEDAERVTGRIESAGDDVRRAREALERGG